MIDSYSLLKHAFQLKLPMKGFEVLIRTYMQLLSSVTYIKKSGVLNPLYSTGSRVLTLPVIIRTSGYIRVKDVGLLNEKNKRQARNDLAFSIRKIGFYAFYTFAVYGTRILLTFLFCENFSRFNISGTTVLECKIVFLMNLKDWYKNV